MRISYWSSDVCSSDRLQSLTSAVTGKKDKAAVDKAYQAAMNGIDAAVGKVDASTRETPAFAHGVVLGILKAAEAEYAEAVKDGDITDAIEYQDSRGFVWVARDYADRKRTRRNTSH